MSGRRREATATYAWTDDVGRSLGRTSPGRLLSPRLSREGWGYREQSYREQPYREQPAFVRTAPRRQFVEDPRVRRTVTRVVYEPVVYEPPPIFYGEHVVYRRPREDRREIVRENKDDELVASLERRLADREAGLRREQAAKERTLTQLAESESQRAALAAELEAAMRRTAHLESELERVSKSARNEELENGLRRELDEALQRARSLEAQLLTLGDELKMTKAQLSYAEFGQSRSDAELAQLKAQLALVETQLDDHRRRCEADHISRSELAQSRADAALTADKLKREIDQLRKALAEALDDNNQLRKARNTAPPPIRQRQHYNDGDKPPFVVRALIDENCPHCCTTHHTTTGYHKGGRKKKKGLFRCTCPR